MRQPQNRPFPQNEWNQLQTTPHEAPHLQQPVFAVMTPDFGINQVESSRQFADLKGVTGRQRYLVPSLLKLFDYRLEKRHVWCVVQINPDLHWRERWPPADRRKASPVANAGGLRPRQFASAATDEQPCAFRYPSIQTCGSERTPPKKRTVSLKNSRTGLPAQFLFRLRI